MLCTSDYCWVRDDVFPEATNQSVQKIVNIHSALDQGRLVALGGDTPNIGGPPPHRRTRPVSRWVRHASRLCYGEMQLHCASGLGYAGT